MTRAALALAAGAIAVGAGHAAEAARDDERAALGPGLVTVELDIHHSRFSLEELRVRAGTTVRFVVHNHDPIVHELVVGPRAVHARHARGTEAAHPPVPGEVSVGPGKTGLTTYEFDTVGTLLFACHLPRHLEYGMSGWVAVQAL